MVTVILSDAASTSTWSHSTGTPNCAARMARKLAGSKSLTVPTTTRERLTTSTSWYSPGR